MAVSQEKGRSIDHVAIIMDGNGRWATGRGLPRLVGHKKGVERVRDVVEAAPRLGVKYLTLYAFSTENWKRSTDEVSGLMSIFRRYILTESAKLLAEGVCVRFIGDRARLDPKLVHVMEGLEEKTAHNDTVHLTVALNYGGRDELRRATTKLAADVKAGALAPEDITEDTINSYLDTHFLPDPDLVIRTSGEARISNFLLWQLAYTEYAFVETLWPDFTVEEFQDIITGCEKRERRFGAVAS